MRFIRCIIIVLTSAFIVACSSSNIPQKLDSFVDNAELNSSDYDAEDWQKSMLQYERLVEEYSNSGKEYTDAEKQMTARAMGRRWGVITHFLSRMELSSLPPISKN